MCQYCVLEPSGRLSRDHGDRIRSDTAVPITHLLKRTLSLEEDRFLTRRRVSGDRLRRLSRDRW